MRRLIRYQEVSTLQSADMCQVIPISVNKHSFEDGVHHVLDLVLIFLELEM